MIRFTLPRDLYHGKDALAALKTLTGKKAMICTGGSSMKKFGFLDKTKKYLEEAGMEVAIFEGIFRIFRPQHRPPGYARLHTSRNLRPVHLR